MDHPTKNADAIAASMLHPEEIRAKLRMKFRTLGEFERVRGLPSRSVTDVLRGRSVRRTERAIARELGVGLHAISRRYADLLSANVDSNEFPDTHGQNVEAK